MKIMAIARVNLTRLLRDRSNLFTMLVVPILIVVLLGSQFGGEDPARIGVYGDDQLSDTLRERIDLVGGIEAEEFSSAGELHDAVGSGDVGLGVVLPPGSADTASAGGRLAVDTVVGPDESGAMLEPVVASVLERESMVPWITRYLAEQPNAPQTDGITEAVRAAAESTEPTRVLSVDEEGESVSAAGGAYAYGAGQQLILMTFLFAVLSATVMIQNRQLGVTGRIMATPTGAGVLVLGEAAGRWLVAMFQGVYIIVATAVLFRVDWGNLLLVAVVLAVFAAVAAGFGMLLGAVVNDESVAVGAGLLLGLGLGALGGAMLPLELFTPTMSAIADAIPHSWALEALATIREGGGITEIVGPLGVLLGVAAGLFSLAAWRLRIVLSRG